jgi:hypothetical protein
MRNQVIHTSFRTFSTLPLSWSDRQYPTLRWVMTDSLKAAYLRGVKNDANQFSNIVKTFIVSVVFRFQPTTSLNARRIAYFGFLIRELGGLAHDLSRVLARLPTNRVILRGAWEPEGDWRTERAAQSGVWEPEGDWDELPTRTECADSEVRGELPAKC